MMIVSQKHERIEYLLKALEFCLPIIAGFIACSICFVSQMTITIERPEILMSGALFLFIPLRSEAANILQRIVGFYLFSVIVNQLSLHYFSLSFLSVNINISYSIIILSLCGTGYVLGKFNSVTTKQMNERKDIILSWVLVLSIVIVHMFLLSLILKKFYGYGYEHNLSVLGNLCLFFLLFIVLWEKLKELRLRQSFGLILTIFFIILIVKNF